MASKQQGRDPKAKSNLSNLSGQGTSNVTSKGMSSTVKDSLNKSKDNDDAEKWLFTKEQQENTPSRRDNITMEKELNYRQQAANLIQDMGQRLPVNQLTINTAIVYMHRFYMFHSFQAFSRFIMAPTALFLAAKVEEQPRKLEHVIKVCHACLHADKPHLDVHSDAYLKQAQELVQNELIMLQSIGFDISIDHPHTHVVKCTQLVKASRDLSQMAYFMATNSLHLTTFCLKYKPTVVSAMCIHLSCKWSNYEIPLSSTGKAYWTYMDPTITEPLLENIINEFLQILNLCPTRLRKLKNYKPSQRDNNGGGSTPSSKETQHAKLSTSKGSQPVNQASQKPPEAHHSNQSEMPKKHTASMTIAEYKNKREKEQLHKVPPKDGEQEKIAHKNNMPTAHPSQRHQHGVHGNSRPAPHPKQGLPHPSHPQKKSGPPTSQSRGGLQVAPTGPQNHHVKQEKIPPQTKGPGTSEHHRRPDKMHPQQKLPHPSSKPSGIPGLQKPRIKDNQAMTQQPQSHTSNAARTTGTEEEVSLKGMELKIMEQMKAEKSSSGRVMPPKTKPGTSAISSTPDAKHLSQSNANHHSKSAAKDHRSRHSHPGHPMQQEPNQSQSQPLPSSHEPKSSLYEQYKKAPDVLRHNLKKKAMKEPLSDEEKVLLHKLEKKKDEERQKRKREHKKHKLNQSQTTESNIPTAQEGEVAASPSGGPLTVRIKLPPSVRAEISQGQSSTESPAGGKVIGSSSGSGSEATISSPGGTVAKSGRKRAHGHDSSGLSDPTSAKQSRKSEGHHHHSSHHGSHDSSRSGRHRHGRPSHHNHHSKSHQANQKIDEAVFQRALEDAVTMVQSAQTGPPTSTNEKAVPTVTLKRTAGQNGDQEEGYAAHVSKHESKHKSSRRNKYSGFDPAAPVSSTLPDDLFATEEDGSQKQIRQERNPDLSSPETGEIRDDDDEELSPFHDHVSGYSGSRPKDWNNTQQWRGNTNNNNQPSSSHYHQNPSNGTFPPPPSLTHGSRSGMHYSEDGQRAHEQLPPLPTLTVKPRVLDQR